MEIVRVGRGERHLVEIWPATGADLVKDVEASLRWELEHNTRFLEKICVDISGCELASHAEMNTDEFTES